mgnify:CR=1 FL=1
MPSQHPERGPTPRRVASPCRHDTVAVLLRAQAAVVRAEVVAERAEEVVLHNTLAQLRRTRFEPPQVLDESAHAMLSALLGPPSP